MKNENVTSFRFALVESEAIPAEKQLWIYRQLELPIAALADSGNESLHAIVRVDAANAEEYRQRVGTLYDILKRNGLPVDTQNRNPSRLSRMPGVTRGGKEQRLLAVNIGRKSWAEWLDDAAGPTGLEIRKLSEVMKNPPPLPEELIQGVLRKGHKMLISGSSKAGKSFLLMELCVAIAEGRPWLGFPVKKGRVLYVNLEIDPASCIHRFVNIYKALGGPPVHGNDLFICNLRGHAEPLDRLVPRLVRTVRDLRLDAVVLDPIYKVITGDENSATDMAQFCNQFDKICEELGCATIYCHHHSKGTQGQKRAMDRASGSGVFARDPDAQLDMIELELDDQRREQAREKDATAWRMESNLREFKNFEPVNFWFQYPLHHLDNEELKTMPAQGSQEAGRMKSKYHKTTEQAEEEFHNAYNSLDVKGTGVKVSELAEYLKVTDKTIRNRVKKMDEFQLKSGLVLAVDMVTGTEDDASLTCAHPKQA